jgi:hypothetical protein
MVIGSSNSRSERHGSAKSLLRLAGVTAAAAAIWIGTSSAGCVGLWTSGAVPLLLFGIVPAAALLLLSAHRADLAERRLATEIAAGVSAAFVFAPSIGMMVSLLVGVPTALADPIRPRGLVIVLVGVVIGAATMLALQAVPRPLTRCA